MDRIPTEFRYDAQRDDAYPRALRGVLRAVFGYDPTLPEEAVRAFAASYYDADPLAEAFVDEVYLARGAEVGRAMLDTALNEGVDAVADAPESLRRLFEEVAIDPPWLEPERVRRGARSFRRFGTDMFHFAGAITLEGYRESSVAKPLALTGAYAGDTAGKRFLETAAFWLDVSKPGGLAPGGEGRRTALRVRIMHVFVRRRLMAHPEWDLDAWGVPISQGDALLTLMGGSVVPGLGLRMLGYRIDEEEIEDLLHFWRYVGHLMGVSPRWYPSNVREAVALMYTSQVKGAETSGADGRELARSYIASYAPSPKLRGLAALGAAGDYFAQLGFVSLFVPPWTHRRYGLPGQWAGLLYLPYRFVPNRALETLGRRFPALAERRERRARAKAEAWVASRLGQRAAEYRAVASFTR